MNLSAYIDNFLQSLESDGHTSKLTIKNYSHYLERFLEFSRSPSLRSGVSGRAKELTLEQIDSNLIGEYKLYLINYLDPKTKKPLKKITQNYFIIALRAFLRYLKNVGISVLDSKEVLLEEVDPKARIKVLEDIQLKQLLSAPDISKKEGVRDRAILETLFSTGLRVSELASLNRDTVDMGAREVDIVGKGGKHRIVNISDSASDWLNKYLAFRKDDFKPLFIRFQGKIDTELGGENMRLTPRSIERIVEKYVKVLGLSIKATPQTLRNSFAAESLSKGIDIHSVQEMLGHNNISTTQIYKSVTQVQIG